MWQSLSIDINNIIITSRGACFACYQFSSVGIIVNVGLDWHACNGIPVRLIISLYVTVELIRDYRALFPIINSQCYFSS